LKENKEAVPEPCFSWGLGRRSDNNYATPIFGRQMSPEGSRITVTSVSNGHESRIIVIETTIYLFEKFTGLIIVPVEDH